MPGRKKPVSERTPRTAMAPQRAPLDISPIARARWSYALLLAERSGGMPMSHYLQLQAEEVLHY